MGAKGSKMEKNSRSTSLNNVYSTTAENNNPKFTSNGVYERHVRIKEPVRNWNLNFNEKTNANMNYNNALKNSRRSIHVNQYNMNNRNYNNGTRATRAKNTRRKTMKMMKKRGKLFLNENNLRNRNRTRF